MKHLGLTTFVHKFIPPRDSDARHLLLLVHGRTGNLKLLEWYSKRFNLPNLAYMTLQAPYPDQRPDQKDPGFSWYLENKTGLEESRKGLIQSIREIEDQEIPVKNIFWLGFSQGSAMGLDLALRAPFQLGGLLCISGPVIGVSEYPEKFGKFAKTQRILVTHGTRDEILPWESPNVGPAYDQLMDLGIPLELKLFDKPHSFHLQQEVPLLEERLKAWIEESN